VEFMFLFMGPVGALPDRDRFAEMGQFAAGLAGRKILRRGAPLARESDAACVRLRDGKAFVSDGPFAESKEVVGGFWILDVASRDEALEIAKRCPHARYAAVQVHRIRFRGEFGDRDTGTPFLLLFRMGPDASDPDGAKGREMRAFGEGLVRSATLFETARLEDEEPSARIETREGRMLVTDGPFAEAKESVGGYGLVRVASRDAAIELATRFPHARWGPIEVREILFFDPR